MMIGGFLRALSEFYVFGAIILLGSSSKMKIRSWQVGEQFGSRILWRSQTSPIVFSAG